MYEEYKHLASALNLRMHPPDPGMMTFSFELRGELEGQPITLQRYAGRGAHFIARARLQRHLDLGLGIGRTGVLWHVAEWLGAREIKVGEPDFDAAFIIRGDEPERVKRLLTPEVQTALGDVGGDFELNDAHISLRGDASFEDVPTLERALRDVAQVARSIEVARASVPPATALLAHHAAFTRFAEEHRFIGETTPLWMHGRVGKLAVSARALRKSMNSFLIELSVYPEERWEGPSFAVRPRRGLVERLLTNLMTTGDAAFDGVFDVYTSAPEEARKLLDDEVRRRLLGLAESGRVLVNQGALSVEHDAADFEVSSLPRVIEEMRIIVESFSRTRHPPGPAYR